MSNARWQRIQHLYHAALERPASARAEFLRDACEDDPALVHEVQSLLDQPISAERFLASGDSSSRGDTSSARVGQRLGVYQFHTLIGLGGMGEVYRATDTKLRRDVAIKMLPPQFTADRERLSRFEREARVLATLNHPCIGAIYGLEHADDVPALVLELIEGPTLADRISQGPIPLNQTLLIAQQIASALDAAHEKGIIHRDLKPANIKITQDDTVKVLDFGLAKLVQAPDADSGTSDSKRTMSIGGTREGMILGTAAYMSPEQARGQVVDKRTDIWAFGCVLWEMLTGRATFARQTVAETIAAILEHEPEWATLPDTTPTAVRRLLRKCLEKDVRRRLRDIGDARLEIEEALAAPMSEGSTKTVVARTGLRRLAWPRAIGVAVVLLGVGIAVAYRRDRPAMPDAVRLSLSAPGQFFTTPPDAVLSPDGRQVALVASDASGQDVLWIRALDSQDARALPGTERADLPFWSPDSRFLGFFADGKLRTVPATGGPVQVLADAPVTPGATWSQNGVILFARAGGLFTIPSTGGAVTRILAPVPGRGILWPHFLPDGHHFLYFVQSGSRNERGVYIGSLDSNENRRLLDSEFEAAYAPPGYLLFVRDEALMAQPFDAVRLELTGQPALLAQGAWVARGYGHGVFSAGSNGTLAYVNAAIANTQLAWFDRTGRPLGPDGPPGRYESPPQLSPSGTAIAVARGPFFQQDIWLIDPTRGTSTRFTFDPAGSRVPVWSADGRRIVFQSLRGDGRPRLYQKSADGAGADERLSEVADLNLQDVSSDGRFLVYMVGGKSGHFELWVLPLVGDRTPFPFLQTPSNNGQAQISPDGRWIAYTSNESGRDEVYIQSFPTAGSKHQVSADGGAQPRWRRDGRELFYLAPDQALMVVPVTNGAPLQVGRPTELFGTRLEFLGLQGPFFAAGYAVAADGQRFLLNAPPEQPVPPITILLNWTAALKK